MGNIDRLVKLLYLTMEECKLLVDDQMCVLAH